MALWDGAACMEIDRFLDARGIRHSPPTLGSTLGSPPGGHGHTSGSMHYPEQWGGPRGSTGQARDFGTNGSDCQAIADALEPYASGKNWVISELIWTRRLLRTGTYYSKGNAYTPSLSLAWQHNNHVHAALGVGRHLPGGAPAPPPQKGFLMALTDAQQGDVYNWLYDLQRKSNFSDQGAHPNYGDIVNEVLKHLEPQVVDLQLKANFDDHGRHPNYGDIVNEVVKQVVDKLEPELARIRTYLTTP